MQIERTTHTITALQPKTIHENLFTQIRRPIAKKTNYFTNKQQFYVQKCEAGFSSTITVSFWATCFIRQMHGFIYRNICIIGNIF